MLLYHNILQKEWKRVNNFDLLIEQLGTSHTF